MRKDNFRFIYICPKCGNILFKTKNYLEGIAKIKCQKCVKVWEFNELKVKRT